MCQVSDPRGLSEKRSDWALLRMRTFKVAATYKGLSVLGIYDTTNGGPDLHLCQMKPTSLHVDPNLYLSPPKVEGRGPVRAKYFTVECFSSRRIKIDKFVSI